MQTDETKESVAEALKELRRIRGEKPVSAEDLRTAQDGLVLTLPGDWEVSRRRSD